jgi:CPA2 family monovalent cation:H+ antiporter-2
MDELVLAASSPTVSLAIFEIGAVFVLLGLLSFLSLKLHISNIPLFLLAGLSLGKGGIVPLELSEEFLNIGAEIGAILLLLVLGFEYSAKELAVTMRSKWQAGVLDLVVNSVPAAVLALVLGYGPLGALAFAGIMFVSSSGIASQLIRETGWSRSVVAKRTTSILVFEDIMLAPYLPLLAALTLGLSFFAGMASVAVALAVTAAVLVLGYGREIPGLRSLANQGPGVLLLLVFGVTLLAAGGASLAGFSGAIAAFLVGLLLTGEVAESLRSRFAPLRELFSAIFFMFFGLSISALDVVAVLPIALAFAAVGIIGKFVVGWWIAKDMADPMSWKRVGAFLSARGEFSMIIAGAVALNVTMPNIREITLAIVVITAIFSTIAMRAFRSKFDH